MQAIQKNLKLISNFLRNKSKDIIIDETHLKFINPQLLDNQNITKKEFESISKKIDSLMLLELTNTQQFTIDYDSVIPYNDYIRIYDGTIITSTCEEPVEIYSYAPKTLKKTCADGKFFEEHLEWQMKLQAMLSSGPYEELFCKVHAKYERKVGLDPRDIELYVFEESLDRNWVNFQDLINSTGGLIRMPFLMTGQNIMHVIRFWLFRI